MRGSHLRRQATRRILLPRCGQGGHNPGCVRRVHFCQIERSDNAMRKENGFGNTAATGSLLKRPQHQRGDRQIGGRHRFCRHRKRDPVTGHILASVARHCLLDQREQMPHLKRIERGNISRFPAGGQGQNL